MYLEQLRAQRFLGSKAKKQHSHTHNMYVKVGRTEFHKETLGAMSLEEALERFERHPKENVEKAWKLAGGKRKTKKKAKKKKSDDE